MLSTVGAVETTLKDDPRKQSSMDGGSPMTILTRDRKAVHDSDSDDDD